MIPNLNLDSAYVLALVGGLVWIIRLEGKVKATADATKTLRGWLDSISGKQVELEKKLIDELTQIKVTLARIDERMRNQE